METKLTLKMDKSVILIAKSYAEKNHRSLSRLVEDYFKKLGSDDPSYFELSPLVKELSGIIAPDDVDHDNYLKYLEKKYE